MLETLEAWAGFILVLIFLSFLIASLFIWIGAKMARIKNPTLKRAFFASIAASIITYIVTLIFSALPIISTIPCYFIGLFFALFVIKIVFNSTLKQAFLVWIFNIAAQIIAVIIGASLFIGGIGDLIKII